MRLALEKAGVLRLGLGLKPARCCEHRASFRTILFWVGAGRARSPQAFSHHHFSSLPLPAERNDTADGCNETQHFSRASTGAACILPSDALRPSSAACGSQSAFSQRRRSEAPMRGDVMLDTCAKWYLSESLFDLGVPVPVRLFLGGRRGLRRLKRSPTDEPERSPV